jgi:hypothetical protein
MQPNRSESVILMWHGYISLFNSSSGLKIVMPLQFIRNFKVTIINKYAEGLLNLAVHKLTIP